MCVCDYQFSDEGPSEVIDRLKEMLDIDAAEKDLDTSQETAAEIIERDVLAGREEVCVCRVSALGFMISWLTNHSFNSERIQIEDTMCLSLLFSRHCFISHSNDNWVSPSKLSHNVLYKPWVLHALTPCGRDTLFHLLQSRSRFSTCDSLQGSGSRD